MAEQANKSSTASSKRLELLANLLAKEGLAEAALQSIQRRPNLQHFPLSSGQQRLWFLDRLETGIHYNDHFDLRLTGPLHVPSLGRALEEILRRHESMRSLFTELDGIPHQSIADSVPLTLPAVDLMHLIESK